MRILVYPTYEYSPNIEADSSYILTKAFTEQASKEKDCFVYWFVPTSPESSGKYKKIQMKDWGGRDMNEVNQYGALKDFNLIDGFFPIDVAISNNAGKAQQLINFFAITRLKRAYVPVVIWDFSTKFIGSDCEISNVDEGNLATHAMAYGMSDLNVFFSRFSQVKAREDVYKYCSPYLLSRFDKNSVLIPSAFDTQEIKPYLKEKDQTISFYFGGRFTATKGGEKILEDYDYLYSFGRDIKIKVTVPTKQSQRLSRFLSKKGQEIEVFSGLKQSEAWEVMSSCHVSIYRQSLKMFPAAPFEQLYAGLVVIFKDYGYEKEILPPDYPFLYKTDSEAAGMVRYVLDNYEESKKKIEYVKEWIEQNVERRKGIEKMLDLMRQKVAKSKIVRRGSRMKMIEDIFAGNNELRFKQLIAEIKSQAVHPDLIFANTKKGILKGFMVSELHQNLIPKAYVDNCNEELPIYEKQR